MVGKNRSRRSLVNRSPKLRKRKLFAQQLEDRRLLAADDGLCVFEPTMLQSIESLESQAPMELAAIAQGEYAPFQHFHHSVSLESTSSVQEVAGRILALAHGSNGFHLHVVQQDATGGLAQTDRFDIEFPIRDMFVHDDTVVIVGFPEFNEPPFIGDGVPELGDDVVPGMATNVALTIDLSTDEPTLNRGEIEAYDSVHHDGEHLAFVTTEWNSEGNPAGPFSHQISVSVQRIGSAGLAEVGDVEIGNFAVVHLRGDKLFHVGHELNDSTESVDQQEDEQNADGLPLSHPENTIIRQFVIGETEVAEVAALRLPFGFIEGFSISDDGESAVLTRLSPGEASFESVVDLIDLSGDEVTLFESVGVPLHATRTVSFAINRLVIQGFDVDQFHQQLLAVVNTNLEIDVSAESRVTQLQLPENVFIHDVMVIGDSQALVTLHYFDDGLVNGFHGLAHGIPRSQETLLVSLDSGEVVSEVAIEDSVGDPFVIDPANGLIGWNAIDEGAFQRIVFGDFSEQGEFVQRGSVSLGAGSEWVIQPDRVLIHDQDKLTVRAWDADAEPIEVQLDVPPTALLAIDDVFAFDAGEDAYYVEPLANDIGDQVSMEIVELVNAPEGVEVIDGRKVAIADSVFAESSLLEFQYVATDGETESTASVSVHLNESHEFVEEFRALLEQLRELAAAELGLDPAQVEETSVDRFVDEPLPIVLPTGESLDLSPGILVTFKGPDGQFALYAGSVAGDIEMILSSNSEIVTEVPDFTEPLVEVGLNAVDDAGNAITQIFEGDEFWIEMTVEDLRDDPSGVYSAYFDLVVPGESMELTGPAEFLGTFNGWFTDGVVTETAINELGGFDQTIFSSAGFGPQSLVRVPAKAIAASEFTLLAEAADDQASETLLRGLNDRVSEQFIDFKPLDLNVLPEPEATDPTGDGVRTPFDALVIVDFLAKHGVTDLAEFESARLVAQAELVEMNMNQVRRLDVDRSGNISMIDVLLVINQLVDDMERQSAVGEMFFVSDTFDIADDDDDAEVDSPIARLI